MSGRVGWLPENGDRGMDGGERAENADSSGDPGGAGGYGVTGVEATVLSHFYRGEIQRANTWRMRLDHTTNWAVITTGGLISFAFGMPLGGQVVLLLNFVLILFFLLIEARRYRYYDVWRTRTRSMEVNWIAPFLDPRGKRPEAPGRVLPGAGGQIQPWGAVLAEDLYRPRFKITLAEAFGRRLRRNYMYLFALVTFAWAVNMGLVLEQGYTVREFVEEAGLGALPGWLVVALQVALLAMILVIAVGTGRNRQASGKVRRGGGQDKDRMVDDDTFF